MFAEHADQIVPRSTLVAPTLLEIAIRVFGECHIGIWIEAVAVDRVAVDRPGRRGDQKNEAIVFDNADHLPECEPEELAMLEHLPRNDDIEGAIRNGDAVWVVENDVYALGER
jgi:hypothetical protein